MWMVKCVHLMARTWRRKKVVKFLPIYKVEKHFDQEIKNSGLVEVML